MARTGISTAGLPSPVVGFRSDPVPNDMLVFDLYPRHSTAVTGKMSPSAEVVEEFVWQPV